jgi:hypothetical protein
LRGFVLSEARPFNWVDVVNTTPNGARIGWLFASTSTMRRDLTHEFTERRPFGDEIDFTDRRLNNCFDAFRNEARAYWSSSPSRQKYRHPPIFAEEPDQPIEMRDADPKFRGSLSNSCSPDDPRPLLCDQPSNFLFPTAGFLPILLRGLGCHVHVAALRSPRMRDKPLFCAAQQGIRPELDESSQINASVNQLKVHEPPYPG